MGRVHSLRFRSIIVWNWEDVQLNGSRVQCDWWWRDHLCIRLIYKYPENAFSLHTCNRERGAVSIAHRELSLIWLVLSWRVCLIVSHIRWRRWQRKKGEWEDLFNIHIHVNNLRCLAKLAHRMAHKGARDAKRERVRNKHTHIALDWLWFGWYFLCVALSIRKWLFWA